MSLFTIFMPFIIKSDRPSVRLSVRSKKIFSKRYSHLNCILNTGHLSRTVTQFLFSIFNNVVHSSELGATPSFSVSQQAPYYVQRYKISQNSLKLSGTVTVRWRFFFQFTDVQFCTGYWFIRVFFIKIQTGWNQDQVKLIWLQSVRIKNDSVSKNNAKNWHFWNAADEIWRQSFCIQAYKGLRKYRRKCFLRLNCIYNRVPQRRTPTKAANRFVILFTPGYASFAAPERPAGSGDRKSVV